MIKNNLKQLYKLKSWLELEKIWLMRQWRHVEMKWGGELNCSQNRHLATKQASPWEHIKSNFSQNPTVSLEQTTTSTASRSPGLRQQAVALHFRQDEQRSARDVCAHRSRETAGACLQARSLVPLSAGKAAFACSLPGCSSASAGRRPPLQCNCPLFPPAALRPRWPSHTHTHTHSGPLPTLQEQHFHHPASSTRLPRGRDEYRSEQTFSIISAKGIQGLTSTPTNLGEKWPRSGNRGESDKERDVTIKGQIRKKSWGQRHEWVFGLRL